MPGSLLVGFALFPDNTHLDFAGPWEVLTRLPGAECRLLSHDRAPVPSASAGISTLPTATYAECPQLDILLVPGGPGHLQAMEDAALLDFLGAQAPGCRYVTSVCTGALVLAAAGLLDGYRATTHWLSLDRLAGFGAIPVPERVVQDRNRITGGGVTAGIDFGFTLAEALAGRAVAEQIQLQIEYAPAPPLDSGSPARADPALVRRIREGAAVYREAMAAVDRRAVARLGR